MLFAGERSSMKVVAGLCSDGTTPDPSADKCTKAKTKKGGGKGGKGKSGKSKKGKGKKKKAQPDACLLRKVCLCVAFASPSLAITLY